MSETKAQQMERWRREREIDKVAISLGLAYQEALQAWVVELEAATTPDSSPVVSDEDIARAFAGTNFGTNKHRELLHVGVLKKACQYHCGHTITTIMHNLGLIRTTGALTKKGVEMLRIAYHKQMIGGV